MGKVPMTTKKGSPMLLVVGRNGEVLTEYNTCITSLTKEDTLMLTIRLPADMETRLNVLADATKRPKSFYVREALERTLEDLEDVYLGEAALERFRASGRKGAPIETVMREYGMEP
jgi:RHH-type rel operon transcriptional repressor/antitoxin RelB